MPNDLFTTPYASDSRIIRLNLDNKESSILVIDRKNPSHIMEAKAFVMEVNGSINCLNQNRVVCTTFGNEREQYEFAIDDIAIYRSL
ncbi:hypothetical protein GCM10028816_00850 [Spirosoma lituiforme]